MKKQAIMYFLGILVILIAVSLKFVASAETMNDAPAQSSVTASWNAVSAGSFIFN